jgi:quercetin dioxygenase-like cupin family protein
MKPTRVLIPVVGCVLLALAAVGTAAQEESPPASPVTSPAVSPAGSPATSPAPTVSAVLLGGGEPAAAPGHELTLRRITLPPGTGVPAHSHPGALVIYIEQGTWGYTALSGTVRLTRASQEGATPAPEDLAMGTEVTLNAGDVLFVEEPADDVRNVGDEDVVLLIAGLTRVGEPFTIPIEDTEGPSPSPAG